MRVEILELPVTEIVVGDTSDEERSRLWAARVVRADDELLSQSNELEHVLSNAPADPASDEVDDDERGSISILLGLSTGNLSECCRGNRNEKLVSVYHCSFIVAIDTATAKVVVLTEHLEAGLATCSSGSVDGQQDDPGDDEDGSQDHDHHLNVGNEHVCVESVGLDDVGGGSLDKGHDPAKHAVW